MKNHKLRLVWLIWIAFLISPIASAIESCSSIFESPPTGEHADDFELPAPPPTNLGDLTCTQSGNGGNRTCSVSDNFTQGNYYFDEASFSRGQFISTSGASTRLFVNRLIISNNADLNVNGDPQNLIIVVNGDLQISGQSQINAIIYVTGEVNISGNVVINGAIASGEEMNITGNAQRNFNFDSDAVSNADFNGMCSNSNTLAPNPNPTMLFGTIEQAGTVGTVQTVNFNRDFASGVTPLIFMMPTINPNDTVGDGSASIRVVSVSSEGFSWLQIEPPVQNGNGVNHSEPMRDVSWIAVEPGSHSLPDGTRFEAGSASVSSAFNFSFQPWTNVNVSNGLSLGISQIQSHNNPQCWFTSAAEMGAGFVRLGLDPSQAFDDGFFSDRCANGGPSSINAETVAYLAYEPGTGDIVLNNQRIIYQFGSGLNRDTERPGWSLAQQCNDYFTDLSGFSVSPIFIGKKEGRFGIQGGWFRRCRLSNNQVSMVVDEDVYGGNRRHLREAYDFVAFEVIEDVAPSIDHFEISYSGTPLTCKAQDVTIKACTNSSCSQLFEQQVSATLNPQFSVEQGGWYRNGNRVTSVNFSGGQVAVQFRNYDRGNITLNMLSPSPSVLNPTLCGVEGESRRTAEQCTLQFADRGFEINAPNKYAAKPELLTIKAIKQDPNDPDECIGDFLNKSQSVRFYSRYITPNAPSNPAKVSVDNREIGDDPNSAQIINIDFNALGEKQLQFNYPEAGKIDIHAELARINDPQGIPVIGSGSFVSVPFGLCFQAIEHEGLASCSADNEQCSVYKTAGSPFGLTVQAKAWQSDNDTNICDNLDTLNYATENGTVLTLSSQVVAPSNGSNGFLAANSGQGDANQYTYHQGQNEFERSISESGIFQLTATAPNSYLGVLKSDLPIKDGVTDSIGRFIPATFDVSSGSLTQRCGAFTYLDQPFTITFTVQAKNEKGNITTNYTGDFAKAIGHFVGDDGSSSITHRIQAKESESSNLISPESLGFNDGVASVSLHPLLNRLSSASDPRMDGPFNSTRFGVELSDNELNSHIHTSLLNADFSAGTNCHIDAPELCTAKRLAETTPNVEFRHGRVVIANAYGSGNKPLKATLNAEYWNGSSWVVNEQDSCTLLTSSMLTPLASFTPAIANAQVVERYFNGRLNNEFFIQGSAEVNWENTGTIKYQGEVIDELPVKGYLRWYWNRNSDAPNTLQNPFSSAYFGQFSGHDKVIYWREVN
ncbi:hypothetical protein JQC92_13685 [Shewanella sp. 202IG2-18]|uniref:DUF6701 domain-containing protein n=1 Tax=Parashewanella hymeniacidonis TaxID=2807618 RepID=UPI001960C876|nr:DUF6701 domain-containing protein [Parashewanella hymeniacidonis]MBM7073068.1 hypothetical protein [Parashewanella hymeniacidonis]